MPLSDYYAGKGQKVMAGMVDRYGAKKGKQVFYATANKEKSKKHAQHAGAMAALRKAK